MAESAKKPRPKVVTYVAVKTNEDIELAVYGMMERLFPELELTEEDLKEKEERLHIAREKDLEAKGKRQWNG